MPRGRSVTQRDYMRRLYRSIGRDQEKVVDGYAVAERRGDVSRRSNQCGKSAEEYAQPLFAGGARRGWID